MNKPDSTRPVSGNRRTNAHKNFEANITPLSTLLKILNADLKRSTASMQKSITRHVKPHSANVKGLERSASKFSERVDSWAQTIRLTNTWIAVMLVTFLVAFLEDELSELARRNPKLLLKDGVNLDYRRIWEVDSVEELRAELRQQWAGGRLKGGPEHWVKFLKRIGGPKRYKGNCVFFMQNLWDIRNLIVHAQGRANPDYVKKYPKPPLKVGDRILIGPSSLNQWLVALKEFVGSNERFFQHYALGRKPPHSHE